MIKNLPASVEDKGSVPGLGRSSGEGNGYLLQYSCLGNPMDREAWLAAAYGVIEEPDTTERVNNNISPPSWPMLIPSGSLAKHHLLFGVFPEPLGEQVFPLSPAVALGIPAGYHTLQMLPFQSSLLLVRKLLEGSNSFPLSPECFMPQLCIEKMFNEQ